MKNFFILLAVLVAFPTAALCGDVRTVTDKALVYDQLDANVFDASVTTINGSAGAIVNVVASISDTSQFCKIWESTGKFIGVYSNGVLQFISVPGMDGVIRCAIPSGGVVGLRNMETGSITSGKIVIQFFK